MFDIFVSGLTDATFAAIAGFGFAYASFPPKRTLIFSALLAAIAHSSRFLMMQTGFFSIALPTVKASFLAGILGMFFAKRLKV
ncbi:MAG: threonine/serine exporter family protein, partial [Campylobacter sp.]|nr:threonine/serine exporter family protein [Campylobacter sp.]